MPKTRQQRRARARNPVAQRRRGAITFLVFLLLILIGGGYLITLFRASPPPLTRGASVGEHWHASYKIYICGKRLTNYPSVEGEMHSHGDGFMHIHPATPSFSGDNASLGTFLRLYETGIGELPNGKRSLIFPDGTSYTDGGTCPGSKRKHNIEVLNKGDKIEGDPAAFLPHEGDAIVIRFGAEGETPLPNPYAKVKGIPEPAPPPPGAEPTRAPD